MFFRLKHSKSGQVLQLLESYRNQEGQPRQRVVVSLGDAALSRSDWRPPRQRRTEATLRD